jgi:hypothetical protein
MLQTETLNFTRSLACIPPSVAAARGTARDLSRRILSSSGAT